jgi:hypothetical protein
MSKYIQLDALVLPLLSLEVPKAFNAIYTVPAVQAECERIERAERVGSVKKDTFRILDRRLQALRKAGRVRSSTKGWLLPLPA